jgi:hypothetical protein
VERLVARAPFHCLCEARLVRAVGLLSDGYFKLYLQPRLLASLEEDASYQLLQPTSCHEHPQGPQLPSLRLSPFRPSRPARHFRPRANANLDAKPSTTTPDSRCRHLRPRVTTRLTPRRPAVATFPASSLPKGAQFSQTQLVSALSAKHESGEMTPDAPCHNLRSDWLPSRPQGNQNSFRPSRANGWCFPSPGRLPPADPTESRSLLALRALPNGPPLIP